MIKESARSTGSRITDARMLRSRRSLHKAFLSLLKRKPLDEISARDIVAEAGLGYSTFFRHFPSKGALLDEVATERIDQLVELAVPALRTNGSLAASIAIFSYVDKNRALWTTLLTGGSARVMREEFVRIAKHATASEIQAGSPWLPTELGLVIGVSTTIEIIAWWLTQSNPMSIKRISEIHDRLVLLPTVGKPDVLPVTKQRKKPTSRKA